MAGAAIIGGSIIGAGATAYSANKAANAQKSAAKSQLALQQMMWNKTQQNLAPFIKGGTGSYNQLLAAMPELTKTFNPTMEQLEQTPGYQFALGQGLKATQNGYAAKGLGSSGAALKGGAEYAQGLASTTYQQQLQNYMNQNLQKYNMLMGSTQVGANAAAGQATNSSQVANSMSSALMNYGNAGAAGWNALGAGIGNAANGMGQNYLLYSMMNGGGGASGSPMNLFSGSNWGGSSGSWIPSLGGLY